MTIRRFSSMWISATLLGIAGLVPQKSDAQTIARRVAATGDGKVRVSFAARPGVCGYNNSISRGGDNRMSWSSDVSRDVEYDRECSGSPVRIVLFMDGGRVTKIGTYVGGRWRSEASGVTDLGTVSVREATDYLIGLALTDAGAAGRDAILPATLADSVVVWPALLRIARDGSRPNGTRRDALFWLAQAAGDRISGNRVSLAKRDDDTEVKKSAVFALSQRRNGEAVPELIEVARRNRDPEVRKSALFWLGQTSDPRAISLFEEILGTR